MGDDLLKFTTNLANQIVYWVLLSLKFLISLSVQTCLNFKYGNVEISIIGYSFWKARWWQTHWYGSHITKLESASMYSLPLEVEKGLLCELDFFPFSLFGHYSNILVSLHEENRQALKIGHYVKNSRWKKLIFKETTL